MVLKDENAIIISIDELMPSLSVHFSLRSELRNKEDHDASLVSANFQMQPDQEQA